MSDSSPFRLECGPCVVRRWRHDDLAGLLVHADDADVAANMRDRFPNPYTEADGRAWLGLATAELAVTNWAIEVGGEIAGGIGLIPQADINAGTAEIGYWLGRAFWGRGIMTAAVSTVTRHALAELGYRRLFAATLSGNLASRRVLEKSGYRLEGTLRRAAVKNGRVHDQALYAAVADGVR